MAKPPKILDLNDWIDGYSTFMADEALKLIRIQGQKKGPEVFRALSIHFLSRVLTALTFETLHERPVGETDKNAIFEHNKKTFSSFKENIQDAVALSFSTAMTHYSGRPMDYYCQIRLVPDMITNTPS